LPAHRYGIHLITPEILSGVGILPQTGVLHLFIKHTSAGLLISETDPTTESELKNFLSDWVTPQKSVESKIKAEDSAEEKESRSRSRIKASLVGQFLTIPITDKKLNLGSLQGIYLCECKHFIGKRKIVATIIS
jgi:secondary thiamine-phosphate synthase enzyme